MTLSQQVTNANKRKHTINIAYITVAQFSFKLFGSREFSIISMHHDNKKSWKYLVQSLDSNQPDLQSHSRIHVFLCRQ